MSVTEQLAAFTAHMVYEDGPSQAYARAKDAILDGLGCALVGSPTSTSKIIVRYVRERGGEARGGVIGGGFKNSAPLAALANGTMAHALDFDDVNWSMSNHPTAPLLPAERRGTSGEELPVIVTITLQDGRALAAQVQHAKGHAAHPRTPIELQEKYEDCAQGVLERPAIRAVTDLVQGLERVEDVGTLMEGGPFALHVVHILEGDHVNQLIAFAYSALPEDHHLDGIDLILPSHSRRNSAQKALTRALALGRAANKARRCRLSSSFAFS
jgi:2-methylcitrate dehydratase PrpD